MLRLNVGVTGIEPAAFRSRTERSTDELHPEFLGAKQLATLKNSNYKLYFLAKFMFFF